MHRPPMTPAQPALPYDPVTNPLYPPADVIFFTPPVGRAWERYLTAEERTLSEVFGDVVVTADGEAGAETAWMVYARVDETKVRALAILHPPGRGRAANSIEVIVWEVSPDGVGGRYGLWRANGAIDRACRCFDPAIKGIVMDWLSTHGRGILA